MRYCRTVIFLILGSLALAQQANQKKEPPPPPPEEKKPAPLFGGKLGIRSSRTTKESATLGFNGIDPSGKVEQQMLATPVKPEHVEKVKQMAAARPAQPDVDAFAKEGGLKRQ